MAVPFVAKTIISQSADNTKVIFTDDSNYSTNTDGITTGSVASRSVAITDGTGAPVATVPMTLQDGGSWAGDYTITKDVFFAFLFTITLTNTTTKTGTTTYVTIGFYNTKYITVMENNLGDCGCKGGICSDVTWAMHNKNVAIIFASKNMGLLSQQSIDAANAFLDNIING